MSDVEAQTEMHYNFIEAKEGKKVAPTGGHKAGSSRDRVCTAWSWWISYPPVLSRPGELRELTVETMAAKEAKNRFVCCGKHLGCSFEAD